jgi:hypothetical protein
VFDPSLTSEPITVRVTMTDEGGNTIFDSSAQVQPKMSLRLTKSSLATPTRTMRQSSPRQPVVSFRNHNHHPLPTRVLCEQQVHARSVSLPHVPQRGAMGRRYRSPGPTPADRPAVVRSCPRRGGTR